MKDENEILKLRKSIETRQGEINKIKNFTPITSCSIELNGIKSNLYSLEEDELINLLVKVNAYYISALDLNLSNDFKISDYKAEEWMEDIRGCLSALKADKEQGKIDEMKVKLIKLLLAKEGKKHKKSIE